MLRRRPTRGMEETVTRALKAVCKKDYFDKYELDSKKALKVCKHITGEGCYLSYICNPGFSYRD